jgi:anti-sigma factor RsiW
MTEPREELQRVLGPTGPDIGCDECFERLDEFVELPGPEADARVPGMRSHLAGCPACREEYESLRALIAEDR